MNKEISEIQVSIDNLMIQTTLNSVKLNVLNSMVLGVLKEKLNNEEYKNVYSNFVNTLEKELNEAFETIDQILFNSGDFLIRQKFENHSLIQPMKRDKDYVQTSD